MTRKILDTNVIIQADGSQSPQTAAQCIELCRRLLFQCTTDNFQIVIDAGPHGSDILAEYQNKLSYYGGSYGEMFVRWLLNNLGDEKHVFQVPLTRTEEDTYQEFPDDPDLRKFDPRDRKWIAAGAAHYLYEGKIAPIVQSADVKWRAFVATFAKYHVQVDFLCESADSDPVKPPVKSRKRN
jgi:hypothetical protein